MRRRNFIANLTTLGISLLNSTCAQQSRWRGGAYRRPNYSRVAILRVGSYEENLTQIIVDGIKGFKFPILGRKVLLKPNLVEYERDTVINTHPAVIGATIEAFRQLGAGEVKVGEGPGHRRDTDGLLMASGLLPYLKDTRTQFVDLNLDDTRKVALLSQYMGVGSLHFAASVLSADILVSMPKIKTHHWAGMTLSMKNLFGIVPGVIYGWPKNFLHWHGIHQSVVDICSTVQPHFVIADGIIAMEGNGPIQGKSKQCGVLVFGDDPVAVDSTCVRLAGLNPEKIEYLQIAGEFLGNCQESRIRQIGDTIANVQTPFELIERLAYLRS
jgi:uncharacterized protein (DUF362 family)